ncbi:hypothetical protein ABEL47_22775 [Escherichia coli]
MTVELKSFDIISFKVDKEATNFLTAYVLDRISILSLLSYQSKTKVYFYIVEPAKYKFDTYTFFGNLVFKNFAEGKYFIDQPFASSVTLATIVKILDSNTINYIVDTIGLYFLVN